MKKTNKNKQKTVSVMDNLIVIHTDKKNMIIDAKNTQIVRLSDDIWLKNLNYGKKVKTDYINHSGNRGVISDAFYSNKEDRIHVHVAVTIDQLKSLVTAAEKTAKDERFGGFWKHLGPDLSLFIVGKRKSVQK